MSQIEPVRWTAETAATFAALGDKTRLRLITRLCEGQPRSIAQLTLGLDLSRQAVTKHLRILERVGMVQSTRVGRESHYTYKPEPVDTLRIYLESVSAQWDDALSRLKSFLEEEEHP